jgi:hypothetical protein
MNLEQICVHGFRYQSSSISFFANPNTSQFGSLELLQHSLDLTEGQSKAQIPKLHQYLHYLLKALE